MVCNAGDDGYGEVRLAPKAYQAAKELFGRSKVIAVSKKYIDRIAKRATNSIPNPPSLTISNSQWGAKSAQHMRDFDLDVSNPAHRQQFRDMVENIGSNPDRVVTGTFSGGGPTGRRDVLFYVQGNDVVVTSPAGEFVTVLQNGVTNPNVVRALGQ